jgi:DNA repair protein RecO (recombination protein O)
VLYKSIKEEEPNESLFQFIAWSLETLDQTKTPIHSFHLLFLVKLTEYLGFGIPDSLIKGHSYFDLLGGLSTSVQPSHSYYIDGKALAALEQLSQMEYPQLDDFNPSRSTRLELLDKLLDFLKIHIPEMTELKSVKILHEIMS